VTETPTTPELTADLPRVLLVANPKCCALFIDGQRVMSGLNGNTEGIELTPIVRELADLAGVTIFEGIDRRSLSTGDVWRLNLADVVARHAELAEAKRLRDEANDAIARASQIEAQS
jgi:hypothetical protein